jgi:pimeloyl-ACP methyl ester carboxylesterase
VIFLSPFLLILGLAQLFSAYRGLSGLSLAGKHRRTGYLVGAALVALGAWWLPPTPWTLAVALPAGAAALVVLAALGSLAGRGLDTARFLRPGDWPEGRCRAVDIPGDACPIPGLLITPSRPAGAAVCLAHGSGDNKTAFKWRLIGALLERGLAVLTIDLAGHGENPMPQRWPDCTREIPAALAWLRGQPGVRRVGLLGISMGGTLSAHAAVTARPDALTICASPIHFEYVPGLVGREIWNLLRSPILDFLSDVTPWQIWRTWQTKPGRREIRLAELIRRLDAPHHVSQLACPLHLVYGERDPVAPVEHAQRLARVAPVPTQLTVVPGASHLALIVIPLAARTLAGWFARELL